jgi:hypothetical protein
VEHTAPAIIELGLLLVLATLAGKATRRLGLPAVLGYLAVGLLVSPFTPGYTANREQLAVLADIGVVLLLFEVGIEINPIHLARQRRLLVLAPAQVWRPRSPPPLRSRSRRRQCWCGWPTGPLPTQWGGWVGALEPARAGSRSATGIKLYRARRPGRLARTSARPCAGPCRR